MRKSTDNSVGRTAGGAVSDGAQAAASMVQVLWQYRRTLALTVMICMCCAALYLLCAKKVYVASAKILIEQNGPRVFSENTGFVAASESFMQSQADAFASSNVLRRALESFDYRSSRMF